MESGERGENGKEVFVHVDYLLSWERLSELVIGYSTRQPVHVRAGRTLSTSMILKSFLSASGIHTFPVPLFASKAPRRSETSFSKSLSFSSCSPRFSGTGTVKAVADPGGDVSGGGDRGSSACFWPREGDVMGVIEFREVDWLGSRKVEPELDGPAVTVSDGRLDVELDPRLDDEPGV
jgi:hypothetical protein